MPPLETPLEAIANNALHFLFDRVAYWDRLGPLPPPPPPRKSKSNKLSGSTMSLDSFLTMNTMKESPRDEFSQFIIGRKSVPTYRRRNSKMPIKIDPSKLNFTFQSYEGSERRKMSKIPEDDEMNVSDYPSTVDLATTPETAGQSVTDYIKKELEKIKEGI